MDMEVAQRLAELYSTVENLIRDGQIDTPWTPLFDLSHQLHELLLCDQCEQLVTDPYEIKKANCKHLVCKGCVKAFSRCKSCSLRNRQVQECEELKEVVSGYRYLCKYIKFNAFFRESVGRDCTVEKVNFITRVIEAANDLETLGSIPSCNGFHENTFDAHQSKSSLQCQYLEESKIKYSREKNQSIAGCENFADDGSNNSIATPVTHPDSVTIEEAVTPLNSFSNIDFDASKDIETINGSLPVYLENTSEELMSSNKTVILKESESSIESHTSNEFMSSEEAIPSEGSLSLNDEVNSEELVSSNECESSNDAKVSLDEVLKWQVISEKELSTSNVLYVHVEELVSSKQLGAFDEIVSMKDPLSLCNEELIFPNEVVNSKELINEKVNSDGLNPSDDMTVGGLFLKELNSSNDLGNIEMTAFSEEFNSSKDNETVKGFVSMKESNDVGNMERQESSGFNDLGTMEMTVSSEELNSLKDLGTIEMTAFSEEFNSSKNNETVEGCLSLKESNNVETIEGQEFSRFNNLEAMAMSSEVLNSSRDSGFTEMFFERELKGGDNVKTMDCLVSSKDLNSCNDLRLMETIVSSKLLNHSNNKKSKEGSISSKDMNAFSDVLIMNESVCYEELNVSNNLTINQQLMSSKELSAFKYEDSIGRLVSSNLVKDSIDIRSEEQPVSSKELNLSNDLDVMEMVSSKESKTAGGSENLNVCHGEETMDGLVCSEELNVSNCVEKMEGLTGSTELSSFTYVNTTNGLILKELNSEKNIENTKEGSEFKAFKDVETIEGLVSLNETRTNEFISEKDINTMYDEDSVKEVPDKLNFSNNILTIKGSVSAEQLNSSNDVTSNKTVTMHELNGSNKTGEIKGNLVTSHAVETSDTEVYFSYGPSTSTSVKRKLDDLCENPMGCSSGSSVDINCFSRSSSPEIECTFSTLELKKMDHCDCNSAKILLDNSPCHEITCPCYLNDRACGSQCFCVGCKNPNDPANDKLKKFIMQNMYKKCGLIDSEVDSEPRQECDRASNQKTSETLSKTDYINFKNTIDTVKLNIGKFRQKPPIINCDPNSKNRENFDFSRANILRFLFKRHGPSGEKPGFVLKQSPSGKIVREPNRELWNRIDVVNRKAIEQAAINPALIAYYIDLNSQSASESSYPNSFKRL